MIRSVTLPLGLFPVYATKFAWEHNKVAMLACLIGYFVIVATLVILEGPTEERRLRR
jgi:hypothetical protein